MANAIFQFSDFGERSAVIAARNFSTSGDYAALQSHAFQRAVAVWERMARRRALPLLADRANVWALPLAVFGGRATAPELSSLWVAVSPHPFAGPFGRLVYAPASVGADGVVTGHYPSLDVGDQDRAYAFRRPELGPCLTFEFEAHNGRDKAGTNLRDALRRAHPNREGVARGPVRFHLIGWGEYTGSQVPPIAGRVGVTVHGPGPVAAVSFSTPADTGSVLRASVA